MEHLCIGSYVRILTSCAIPAERKFSLFCEKIMLSLCEEGAMTFSYKTADGNDVFYDETNFNKILGAGQNLPTEVMQMALTKDARSIERYFIESIIPKLEESRKKNAVFALKDIILKDALIVDNTQLGTISRLTKDELRDKNEFVLSEFLTDIFIYAVAKTDNLTETEFTKSIGKNFYSEYDFMADWIRFYEVEKPKVKTVIPLTSMGKFDKVFSFVSSESLAISANHDLQIFCLKFDDYDFDYQGLCEYLGNNIGYYIYSRAQIQRYMDNSEFAMISYNAIKDIKGLINSGKISAGNELGELLLYIFLEQVLKAPKLMSGVEISSRNGVLISESAGIHLLTADAKLPFAQVILGTSMINDDLELAIDESLIAVQKLKERGSKERRFVESIIFDSASSNEMYNQMESIILPSENGRQKPSTAFGIFVGYSLTGATPTGISIDEYHKQVLSQLKADISNEVPFIESKIRQYGLDGYSFYIYLLPFSDADKDKNDILDNILQVKGDMQ